MRKLKSLTILMAVALTFFSAEQADAQLLNPCCRPVPACCGPVIVRRPIIRNAAAELRMAAHYHLNYRYYRGLVYGSSVTTDSAGQTSPTPAEVHSTEKPYHEPSAGQGDSVLQPVQPAVPLQPVQPVQPAEPKDPEPQNAPPLTPPAQPADQPEAAPTDDAPTDEPADQDVDEDAFQIEQPTTATLMLTVPQNAVVRINGKPTSSTGTTRTFISRNLTPTARYHYNIEVSWANGTSNYKISEVLEVSPGRTVAKIIANPYSSTVVKK